MTAPPWEPSAWLRDAVSNRLKNMAMALEMADEHTIVILSLTDRPKGEAALRWEFTCDHCGKFCLPEREKFITGDITTQLPGIGQINITVGLCAECAAIEQVPQPAKE